ncbi:hypothetical protein Tco_1331170 [Tanacetum coccineum]
MIHNELSKIDLSKGYSGGGVVDLNSDKDPTDEDGDIGMGDSTGKIVGGAIGACGNSLSVASYACMAFIYGSS